MSSVESLTIALSDFLLRLTKAVAEAAQDRLDDMTGPIFIGAVLAILVLERIMPAKPNQPIFSASFFQDIVWAFLEAIGGATVLLAWSLLLRSFYDRYLSFLTLDLDLPLPSWMTVLLALILLDFLRWLQHLIQHKVPWFWQFHALHHSQPNLNLFSDYRYHVVEYLVRQAVYFIPMMMLGVSHVQIFWIMLILVWHARFYHANIKANFGPLRYIIVTPQSHRVHHSIEERHQDKNFGAFLSVWDWMLGTQYKGHTEYPDTGITDTDFPVEKNASPFSLIYTPVLQMIYPFRKIGESLTTTLAPRRNNN